MVAALTPQLRRTQRSAFDILDLNVVVLTDEF
jgi:hypothetical protein